MGAAQERSSRPEVPGAHMCAGDTSGGPHCPPIRVLHVCAASIHKLSAGAGAEAAVPWRGAASPC
jgi:hypothetical protein